MTTPPGPPIGDGASSAILLKLGEMSAQLAVMQEQLKAVPDHERRIRALERFRFTVGGVVLAASAGSAALATWLAQIGHH